MWRRKDSSKVDPGDWKENDQAINAFGSQEKVEPCSSKGEADNRIYTVKSSKGKNPQHPGNGSSNSKTGGEGVFLAGAANTGKAGRGLQRCPIVSSSSCFLPSWLRNYFWRHRLLEICARSCWRSRGPGKYSKDRFRKCMCLECRESMTCQLLILPARCERIFQESEQAKDAC